jgi:hypothetical protein
MLWPCVAAAVVVVVPEIPELARKNRPAAARAADATERYPLGPDRAQALVSMAVAPLAGPAHQRG